MTSFLLRRDKDEKHVDLRLILNYNNKKEAKLTLAQRWSYVRKGHRTQEVILDQCIFPKMCQINARERNSQGEIRSIKGALETLFS